MIRFIKHLARWVLIEELITIVPKLTFIWLLEWLVLWNMMSFWWLSFRNRAMMIFVDNRLVLSFYKNGNISNNARSLTRSLRRSRFIVVILIPSWILEERRLLIMVVGRRLLRMPSWTMNIIWNMRLLLHVLRLTRNLTVIYKILFRNRSWGPWKITMTSVSRSKLSRQGMVLPVNWGSG